MSLFENFELVRKQRARESRVLPSPDTYQQAILDAFAAGTRAICVDSAPGSGKTTLLELLAQHIVEHDLLPDGERAVFLSYSQKIVKQLKKVLPAVFDIRTLNSLGYAICRENLPDLTFEPRKYEDLTRQLIRDMNLASPAQRRELTERLGSCVQLHVGHALGLDTSLDDWCEHMIFIDAPVLGAEETLYHLTHRLLRQGLHLLQQEKVCSFLDQTLAPLVFGWTLAQPYHFILADELQDLDRASLEILAATSRPDTRLVGVGDENQSIFGYKGADRDAIQAFAERFAAERHPLSICYRCPSNHVAFASAFTSNIEPAPQAHRGILEERPYEDLPLLAGIGDLVICRVNAPLVTACYDLVRAGIPALIAGRDLSKTLVAFTRDAATWDGQQVRRERLSDALGLEHIREQLDAYASALLEKISARAEREGRDADMQIAGLADKLSVIDLILEQGQASTLGALVEDIRRLFRGKEDESVVLGTIHSAKGLEAHHVFLLQPELLPHPKAKTPRALADERCVTLVALTRAKQSLRLIHTPGVAYDRPLIPPDLTCCAGSDTAEGAAADP